MIRKKRSILTTLLLSNFFILIVVIVITGISFSVYQANIRRIIEQYHFNFITQIKNTFDERLSNTNQILNGISLDIDVQSLVFQKSNPDKYERYTSRMVLDKLQNYGNEN